MLISSFPVASRVDCLVVFTSSAMLMLQTRAAGVDSSRPHQSQIDDAAQQVEALRLGPTEQITAVEKVHAWGVQNAHAPGFPVPASDSIPTTKRGDGPLVRMWP